MATVGKTTRTPIENTAESTTGSNRARPRRRARRLGAALAVPALVAGLVSVSLVAPAEPASASSRAHYTFTPAKVVKVAKRYAGASYRFGGASPRGFDCSGYTKYVYSKFGIHLPHSAYAQSKVGSRVSKKHAKPGDLVVLSGGSHVGIYVGRGKFIDAPMPGRRVHTRSIYSNNYKVVRVKKYHSHSS